ncbi:nucleotidyltransferase domain-containing protein [Microbacterium sp. STN6]|uniref:nucleotidyltransferase domain-containing protein n=1 Tax=Microbacterium sp. STN6 TaxID=2995588 RepID=UPI002260E34F|nr:nucleotidyltransferase domain-containing protein [Microbacterium sp. STN6]MCX7521377.1 nucleotidyltransferase domain-containing protein [Microbacterium sp. STN6]
MDLSHPEYAVLGEDRARVLHRLFVLAEPASGRRIHQLSGVKTLRTTQRILEDAVSIGLASVRSVGSANVYEANRDHVMWGPIEQILALSAVTEQRVAEILRDIVNDYAAGTALYGSFARGEAGPHSDIDILIVWNDDVPEERQADILDAAAERVRRLTGNRAQLFALTRAELDRLIGNGAPLIHSLRTDARSLTGVEIKRLLNPRAT